MPGYFSSWISIIVTLILLIRYDLNQTARLPYIVPLIARPDCIKRSCMLTYSNVYMRIHNADSSDRRGTDEVMSLAVALLCQGI